MKQKLFLLLCALLTLVGTHKVQAYTTGDLESAGWTKTTDLGSLTLSDNYFVFVDAGASATAVAVGNPAVDTRAQYTTLANPFAASQQVWKVAQTGDNYTIQNLVNDMYFVGGPHGWDSKMSNVATDGDYTFTLIDGKYKLSRSTGYMGPWNDNGSVSLSSGYEQIALNKGENKAPGYYVYYISRTAYAAARRNGAALASEGWSQVTVTSGLNLAGYYYALLDMSEAGYESGFVITGNTGGRPQSTALTDPITNTKQLWFIEGHGENYALKCLSDNKYFYCKGGTSWDTGFTTDINDHADFTMTVNDGKWTLNNTCDGSHFVGRWADDTAFHPFDGESIAANKSAGSGKKQYLIYSIPTIAGVVTELPANGNMVADTWYYIDITVADNYNASATTLGDIVYTTNGTILVRDGSTVTANFEETGNALSVARYYVKSSSANHFELTPNSFTYIVGTPTLSIVDGDYTNICLASFTFNFSEVSTNDPGASFALLNGSAKASLKKGGVEQAQGTLSLDGTVLTATFSEVTLDLASTYTIDLAAGVVGYEGHETNAAVNSSFKTGVIADDVYYFKQNGANKFATRGGHYGTEAVVDNFGLSFEVAIQSDGKYTLKNVDCSFAANADKYLGYNETNNDTYTDRGLSKWTIESTIGGYYLLPEASTTRYIGVIHNAEYGYDYFSTKENVGDAIVWTLLSKAEYADALVTTANAQASAIATAAGKSASTVAELETLLATDFGTTDMTSSINGANLKTADDMSQWTQVKYNDGAYKDADCNGVCAEIWNSTGGVKQDITSLPEGIYKVTVCATWRPGNQAAGNRAGSEANTTAWMYANTATSNNITQLKRWYDGDPDVSSRQAFVDAGDTYLNTTYVYVSEGETLTVGLASPSYCVEPWFPFYGFTLTHYEAKATPAQKEALADAIIAAEAKTLGFETSEYAPYNNVAALEALAAAQAINPETASGEAVVAATTALTGATWTANTTEENAISWEDYTSGDIAADGYIHPRGWTNTGYNTRIYSAAAGNKSTNTGISAVDDLAMMMKYNTTYGETTGYTMPLKAATVYQISFKYCGWGNNPTTNIVLTDPNNENIALAPGFRPATNDGNTNAEDWYDYTGYFVTTTAGNYVFAFNKVDGGQQQIGIGDIELKKAASQTLTFSDAAAMPTYAPGTYPTVRIERTISNEKWNTFVVPVSMANPTGWEVKEIESFSENTLSFTDAASIEAGKSYMVKPAAALTYFEASNVAVSALETNDVTVDGVTMKGVYRSGETVPASNDDYTRYAVVGGELRKVLDGATVNIKPFRAYFELEGVIEAREILMNFDDETAINAIDAAEVEAEGLKDGKYFIEGKIVIVKNAVKYSANGQILK